MTSRLVRNLDYHKKILLTQLKAENFSTGKTIFMEIHTSGYSELKLRHSRKKFLARIICKI